MHHTQERFEELRVRLETDVARTLGAAHVELVRAAVANLHEFQDQPSGEMLIEDVQQAVHDTFVDSSWPACSRHARHPLWYRDGQWWCETDGVPIANLGELASSKGWPV